MPPGPKGYPVLGNVLEIDFNDCAKSMAVWREDFGDIYTINLLGTKIIVVCCTVKCYRMEVTRTKTNIFLH